MSVFFDKLDKFLVIISSNWFHILSFSSSFWNSCSVNVTMLVVVLEVS